MKKAALIVPKGSKYGKNQYLKDFLEKNDIVSRFYGAWETPNLSLLTIAGLFPDAYDLTFIDEDHGEEISFSAGYDLVVVTGMTQQINRAYEICLKFRESGSYTIIGGIHASIYPDEASQYADTVIVGEGEEAFRSFLIDYENRAARPLYRATSFVPLTQSPAPRYDLLNTSLYSAYSIQTTRGCPRTCSYCTLPIMYGAQYRFKEPKQVLHEVHALKSAVEAPFVFFADDNMFINRENSYDLLRALAKEGIAWGTQTDISIANHDDLLAMLRDSGCRWLFIGFESTAKKNLELLDKKQWKAGISHRYASLIEKIHKAGVQIWGSFMFGTDYETTDVFRDTLDFAVNNGIYSGSFTILTPLPGTELFLQMERESRIIDYDWSRYTFWDVVYKPKNMSAEELAQGVAWVYDQFYSPAYSQKRMAAIRRQVRPDRGGGT